jgi:hypothetical protein
MGRGRALQLIAVALCALALIAVGARYFIVRNQRQDTEQNVLRLTRQAGAALALLHRVTDTRVTADEHNLALEAQRNDVRALATSMHDELDRTRADTTTAEVGAFTTGAQANSLADCLTGVSQALNQLAVGDSGAIKSLKAVDGPCRAAGVA